MTLGGKETHKKESCWEKLIGFEYFTHLEEELNNFFSGPRFSGLRRQLTWKTLYLRKWVHLVWKDLNDSAITEESLTVIEVGLPESTTSQPQHGWHWGPDNGLPRWEMQETWVQSSGQEDILEKEMATHPNILTWEIPRTQKPGGLQSMGS